MNLYSIILDSILLHTFLIITPAVTTILVFILVLFFVLSFLLSGAEVAYFSLTLKDLNMLKTRTQPTYRRIVNLLASPKTLLTSILIGNTIVNIGIVLIANSLISDWIIALNLNAIVSFIIKAITITIVLVLFGEVLPKVWATHHKIWFASTASMIVEIFNGTFYKISKQLVGLSENIERNFDSRHSSMDDAQLDDAIDLLPENEATLEEKQILKGIRKFGNTTVKQIMRTRLDVSGIEIQTSFQNLIIKIQDMHYSRIPVYDNNLDEIKGLLHTKDLIPYLSDEDFDWHSLLRQVFYVHEQKLIEDLLQDFRNKRIHMAVVVDEFGGTSGIVTLEDIMEEIIGDIQDEFDDEQSVNKKLDDHNYIFEGKTMIKDVCMALKLPSNTFDKLKGESDSLAGLFLEIAGEFPQINDRVLVDGYIFTALDINKNRIEKVKVTLQPNAEV